MNKFKKGDEVKIINHENRYFNYNATIIMTDSSPIPYLCKIKLYDDIKEYWYREEDLTLIKNVEKYFTISVRKHKRINLNFNL